MKKRIIRSLLMTLFLSILLCGVYPLAVTLMGKMVFPQKVNGGFVNIQEKTVGARLIAQSFQDAKYFHGRPSAAGANGYDASASSGSNLGPTNKKLIERIQGSVKSLTKESPEWEGRVPTELVTTSASGLDPHISPETAKAQVKRVAIARGVSEDTLLAVVNSHIEEPKLGFLGDPVVNVLLLNLALDGHHVVNK